jgi:hypothetical protein
MEFLRMPDSCLQQLTRRRLAPQQQGLVIACNSRIARVECTRLDPQQQGLVIACNSRLAGVECTRLAPQQEEGKTTFDG